MSAPRVRKLAQKQLTVLNKAFNWLSSKSVTKPSQQINLIDIKFNCYVKNYIAW